MNVQLMRKNAFFRCISFIQAAVFLFSSLAFPIQTYAQSVMELPAPGMMVGLSDAYVPVMLRAVKIHPDQPLVFDFIVDSGNTQADQALIKAETQKLVKYFLASLTIPEKDLWVNLSPYENDRIATESFGQTQMGRDLLAQDYVLKQLSASLINPEKDLGKEFWARVYAQVQEKFGTSEISTNAFNKVWIMPDSAEVYEMNNTAILGKSHLKVMMEKDYLAWQKNAVVVDDARQISDQAMRQIVLPEIEKEINAGKNFAVLRQVYQSLILATWYKNNLKESLLAQVYADQNKVDGVNTADKADKENIYARYIEAYKQGVFNLIKEEVDPLTNETSPRQYFSGGADFAEMAQKVVVKKVASAAQVPAEVQSSTGDLSEVTVAAVKAGAVDLAQAWDEALASKNGVEVLPFFNGDEDILRDALVQWQREYKEKLGIDISVEDLLTQEEFFELLADDGNARDGRIKPRKLVHLEGDKHRDARIFLVNKDNGKFLIQHRDNTKDVDPLLWAEAVGGHTGIGETYRQNAAREIWEEMKIEVDGKALSFFGIFNEENKGVNAKGSSFWNRSAYGLFLGMIDGEQAAQIVPNIEDGIDQIEWLSFEELKERARSSSGSLVPWLREKLQDEEFLANMEEAIKYPGGKNFALPQEKAVEINDVLASKKKMDGMFLDGETPGDNDYKKFAALAVQVPQLIKNVDDKIKLLARIRGVMAEAASLTDLDANNRSLETLKVEVEAVIVKNRLSQKKADAGLLLTMNGILAALPIIHALKMPEQYLSDETLKADIQKIQDFIYIERGRVYRSPEMMSLIKAAQRVEDQAYIFYLNKRGVLSADLPVIEAAFKEEFDHQDLEACVAGWASYNAVIQALEGVLKVQSDDETTAYARALLFLSKMKQVDLIADNILSHPNFETTMKTQDLRKFILLSGIPGGGKGTVGDRVKRYWGKYIEKVTLFHERGPRPSETVDKEYYNRVSAQLQGAISEEMLIAAGISVGDSIYASLELAGIFKKEKIVEFDGEEKFYYFVAPDFQGFDEALKAQLAQDPAFKGDVDLFENIVKSSQQMALAILEEHLAIATVNNQKQGLALDTLADLQYFFHLTADGAKAITYIPGGKIITVEGLRGKLSGSKITFLEGGRDWQLQIKKLLGEEYTSVFIMPMSEKEIQDELDTTSVKAAYEEALKIHLQDVERQKQKDPTRTDFKKLAADSTAVGIANKATGDAGLTEYQRREFVIMRQTILRIHKRNIDDEGGKMTAEKDMKNRAREAAAQVLNAKDNDKYKVILVNAFQDTAAGYYKMANEMVVDLGSKLFNALVSIGYEPNGGKKVDSNKDLGGIDFDPASLKLKVLRTSQGIQVQVDPAEIQRIKTEGVNGFAPVIINIVPVKSMLGVLN